MSVQEGSGAEAAEEKYFSGVLSKKWGALCDAMVADIQTPDGAELVREAGRDLETEIASIQAEKEYYNHPDVEVRAHRFAFAVQYVSEAVALRPELLVEIGQAAMDSKIREVEGGKSK